MKHRYRWPLLFAMCLVMCFLCAAVGSADDSTPNELNNMTEPQTFKLQRTITQAVVPSSSEMVLTASNDVGSDITRACVLILDNSVSIKGTPLTYLKQAAKKFCSDLLTEDKNSEIAIVVYDKSIAGICPFTNGLYTLYQTIDSMSGDGSWTNINEAAVQAHNMLMQTNADTKNMIIMTDGLPTYGEFSASGRYSVQDISTYYSYTGHYVYEYANALYKNVTGMFDDVNVYTLGYFHNMSSSQKIFASKLLNDIQNAGYYEVTNPNDLEFVFGEIADDVTGDGAGKEPIIVIPGIMGSRLFMNSSTFDESSKAWDPVISLSGITQLNERLDLSNTLYVRPCENQNVNVNADLPNSTVDDYGREYGAQDTYKELVDRLCKEYAIGTDNYRPVYFFSYDWRKSNTESAKKLNTAIQSILKETGAKKVDLVCHSMGGLVASKYYVEYRSLGQVDQIITCGTPYEGAPKLIDSVMNWNVLDEGVLFSWGNVEDIILGVFGGMQTKLKASFKGVTELTPTKNYVSEIPMQKDSWAPFSLGDYDLTYSEYKKICSQIFNSYSSACDFQESLKDSSYNALLKYENAYFVVGINQKTITAVKFQFSNNDIDERLYESDLGYDTLGDGTVPFFSSSICEQLNKTKYSDRVYKVSANHGDLVKKEKSLNWVVGKLNSTSTDSSGDSLSTKPYIVIRIACPVDVSISKNGEKLSSSVTDFSDRAAFGRLDLIGLNNEIKMLCLDKDDYSVVLTANGAGTMDYTIRFFDANGNLKKELNYSDVPLTPDTIIRTGTSDLKNEVLRIDNDGDGTDDFFISPDPSLQIIEQPTDQFVIEGQRATFSIQASDDQLTYQWYVNRSKGKSWEKLNDVREASYTTSETDLTCDGFQYYCLVADPYGNTVKSNVAVLHVSRAPELPQTGDSSSFMVWLSLVLLSMLGILALRRRA